MSELPSPPFFLTPEDMMAIKEAEIEGEAEDGPHRQWSPSEKLAGAIGAAALYNYYAAGGTGSGILVPFWGWGIEELFIDIEPGARFAGSPASRSNTLTLVVFGIPSDDTDDVEPCQASRFPLKRISDTRWECETLIELMTGDEFPPYLTMVIASADAGDLGHATFSEVELESNISGSSASGPLKIVTKQIVDEDTDGVEQSCNLGISFIVRKMITRKSKVLSAPQFENQALFLIQQAVDYRNRYQQTQNTEDLEQALATFREALELIPRQDPDRIHALYGLAESLRVLHTTSNQPDHLDELVDVLEEEIALRAADLDQHEGHEPLARAMFNLHLALRTRYENFGNITDLDRAIDVQRQVIDCDGFSGERVMRSVLWDYLGVLLLFRFKHLGNPEDINKSIEAHATASRVYSSAEDLEACNGWKTTVPLGTALLTRFKSNGADEDLEQGLFCLREAAQKQPGNSTILTNLGAGLMRKFEKFGDLADINEAISTQQQALKNADWSQFASKYSLLNNLGLSFLHRYNHSQDHQSLEEATKTIELAVDETPKNNSTRPSTLNNLAWCYEQMYDRTHNVAYIYRAISAQREAVETLPEGHSSLPIILDNLGRCYQALFETTGELEHIQQAVDSRRKALETSSPDNSHFKIILDSLGRTLNARFFLTQDMADVCEAIELKERALRMIPENHSYRAGSLNNLAESFISRYEVSRDPSDLESGFAHFHSGTLAQTSSPYDRFRVATNWVLCALRHDNPTQAISAFDALVDAVPLFAGVEQTVQQRHELLMDLSSHILHGASVAISSERIDKALEWLEQGRGLVWNQISSLRTPLDDLRAVDATWQTALKLSQKRSTLLGPAYRTQGEDSKQQRIKKYRFKSRQARTSIPGFENFLRPLPSSSWTQNLPDAGPVVVINVHATRCDAIVLMAGLEEPMHIPLPDFSHSDAVHLSQLLQATLEDFGLSVRGSSTELNISEDRAMRPVKTLRNKDTKETIPVMEGILMLLWTAVVKPILNALAISRSEDPTTRIWWCPTGPLSFLPLHAAGIYRGEAPETLSDYAVSSYIPTVAVLTERVKASQTVSEEKSGIFLLSQPNAPGSPPIPGTTAEVERISQAIKTSHPTIRTLKLESKETTIKAGKEGMENYSCVHLACHAKQDLQEPLNSGFRLQDGRLKLSSIIKLHIKSADFAFLSACETSTGSHKLSEEAVHLAAGMLAAGYRGVVGTMWSIQDRYAPEIAEDFYADLLLSSSSDSGRRTIDSSKAAYSLHRAVRRMRARHGDTEALLLAWVPYVHFGL